MPLPVRLATEADVGAIFSMRRAREVWLAARGIRQWPIGMVSIDHVTAQVRGGQWWVEVDVTPVAPRFRRRCVAG